MSRLLRACLVAYPRDLRARDGDDLLALADELGAAHGVLREALGLLRGGWAERRRGAGRRRRVLVAGLVGVPVLALLTWSAAAAATPGRVEVERFGCAGDCSSVERQVAERERTGWACVEEPGGPSIAWRCTLD